MACVHTPCLLPLAYPTQQLTPPARKSEPTSLLLLVLLALPSSAGIGVPAAAASGMMAANSLAPVFDHLAVLNELAL